VDVTALKVTSSVGPLNVWRYSLKNVLSAVQKSIRSCVFKSFSPKVNRNPSGRFGDEACAVWPGRRAHALASFKEH
jgi:hypothetical protein